MKRITVAFLRQVLKDYDNEEITFAKMVELLNNEAPDAALEFLHRLKDGGSIVSSNNLTELAISQAQACKRFFVDKDGYGFAYIPIWKPYRRNNCIFQFCPHPDLCKDECQCKDNHA